MSRLRARRQHRGLLGLEFVIAAGWAVVLTLYASGHADWLGHEKLEAGLSGWPVVAAWSAMVLAMMVPSSVPVARYVSANTLRSRREVCVFVAGYLSVWIAFMVVFASADTVAHRLVGADSRAASAIVTGVAFVIAATWQLTARKRHFVIKCRQVPLLPARGDAACRRLGLGQGTACVGSCGPLMLATMSAPFGRLFWMVAMALLAWLEKAVGLRRRLALLTAQLLAAAAVVYVVSGAV